MRNPHVINDLRSSPVDDMMLFPSWQVDCCVNIVTHTECCGVCTECCGVIVSVLCCFSSVLCFVVMGWIVVLCI